MQGGTGASEGSSDPLEALLDPDLWKQEPGYNPDPFPVYLENGYYRYDHKDGSQDLYGHRINGQPVIAYRAEGRTWWVLDAKKATKELTGDHSLPGSPASEPLDSIPGGQIERHPRGKNGTELVRLLLPGCDAIAIRSKSPLTRNRLENLASVLPAYPPRAFKLLHHIFVFDSLGEGKMQDGRRFHIKGTEHRNHDWILLVSRDFDNPKSLAASLDHEIGHRVDDRTRLRPISSTARGSDGKALYGTGSLSEKSQTFDSTMIPLLSAQKWVRIGANWIEPLGMGQSGEPDEDKVKFVDLRESSFPSMYAARDKAEDFADSHAFYFRLARDSNRSDFVGLSGDSLKKLLDENRLSPEISAKMQNISEIYRQFWSPAHRIAVGAGPAGILISSLALARRLLKLG